MAHHLHKNKGICYGGIHYINNNIHYINRQEACTSGPVSQGTSLPQFVILLKLQDNEEGHI